MMHDANKYMDGIFRFYAFFDKLSYKILCFSSYGLKDMKNTRFTNLQEFQKTEERRKKNYKG
jgi:hypothetical protein